MRSRHRRCSLHHYADSWAYYTEDRNIDQFLKKNRSSCYRDSNNNPLFQERTLYGLAGEKEKGLAARKVSAPAAFERSRRRGAEGGQEPEGLKCFASFKQLLSSARSGARRSSGRNRGQAGGAVQDHRCRWMIWEDNVSPYNSGDW